ncbi:MAG: phosphoribosyltransferase family protein [Treponema sp.]|jgi:adenine/guanine phosphoribosyltransferase-like PRPP-binding protein|nr:phosphoribosyltransferase family protein [Treponema sp.]
MDYKAEDVIRLARRNYKGSRSYVIVNPLQGKHLPVHPKDALAMMQQLGRTVNETFRGERLLCVGFAETATAIGAAVAAVCNCAYIHTTRERVIGDDNDLTRGFVFSETHSRWPEQKLRSVNWEKLIRGVERIVFVDDEISTGKTIRTAIACLEEMGAIPCGALRFAVASIVNEVNEENAALFEEAGIQEVHLVKAANDEFEAVARAMEPDLSHLYDADDLPKTDRGDFTFFEIGGKEDPRSGVVIEQYIAACARFADELSETLALEPDTHRILLLGTEEFMFPVLYAAQFLERKNPGLSVYTHSTTCSPIAPCSQPGYPISSAYRLRSVYDCRRETFVYNLASYDRAVIATDSELDSKALIEIFGGVHRALVFAGVKKITAVKWKTFTGQTKK